MQQKLRVPALVFYLVGLVFMGAGVPLMIKTQLGVTVISSFPYSIWLITSTLTTGMWITIIQCAVLVGAILLLKRLTVSMVASFITAYLLGLFVDIFTVVWAPLVFEALWLKLTMVVVSSAIMAFGAGLTVYSKYPPIPDLVFLRDVAKAKNMGLTKLKLMMDGAFFAMTVTLTLVFLGRIDGVGVGTVISVSMVGYIVGQTNKLAEKLFTTTHFASEEKETAFFEFNLLSVFKPKPKELEDEA